MSFRMLSNRFNINLPGRKRNLHQRNVILSVNLVDPTQLGVGSYLSVKWLAADLSNKYFRAVILTLEVILSAFGVETGNQNDK